MLIVNNILMYSLGHRNHFFRNIIEEIYYESTQRAEKRIWLNYDNFYVVPIFYHSILSLLGNETRFLPIFLVHHSNHQNKWFIVVNYNSLWSFYMSFLNITNTIRNIIVLVGPINCYTDISIAIINFTWLPYYANSCLWILSEHFWIFIIEIPRKKLLSAELAIITHVKALEYTKICLFHH